MSRDNVFQMSFNKTAPNSESNASSGVEHRVVSPTTSPADTVPRNFLVLMLYQIVMRIGWIFKTESIVMPAVLDSIGGPSWLRGCLPLLNRFGHSIPPVLFARRLSNIPLKKRALATLTLIMSFSFLALALLWWFAAGHTYPWMPIVFLALYALFFASTGLNQQTLGTIQGKLIHVKHRGRMLLCANLLGALSAITVAWFLLEHWLSADVVRIDCIFGFSGLCFGLAAFSALLLAEQTDQEQEQLAQPNRPFREAWLTLCHDANFRHLATIAALFGTSIMLFPHYQALARERLGLSMPEIIQWIIVQNIGTAFCSLALGPLADWRGYRAVLRISLLVIAAIPLVALGFANSSQYGRSGFPLVFLFLGLTPVTFKVFSNYTLEICSRQQHPLYLGTLSLCLAAPALASPLVGALVDWLDFEIVFLAIAILLFGAWILTWTLGEPREDAM